MTQKHKILWTAEKIVRNYTFSVERGQQFLDADEVKRIIEDMENKHYNILATLNVDPGEIEFALNEERIDMEE